MSIYATTFVLDEHSDHTPECDRLTVAPDGVEWDICIYGSGRDSYFMYDPKKPCTCAALRGPYKYHASNQSILDADHERHAHLFVCRAVGTNTIRMSLPDGVDTVLLDGRQVRALRDALDAHCKWADNPEEYGRQSVYDADSVPLDDQEAS